MKNLCQHCQQPMLSHKCDQCFGTGYLWARDEVGHVPIDCPTCGGEREEHHCTNDRCSGKRWYPLSAREHDILRMVQQEETDNERMERLRLQGRCIMIYDCDKNDGR